MMMILERDKDTIAAVSTAPGTGGIAVVRISGTRALEIAKNIADFLPTPPESHRLYFGTIQDPRTNEPIDEVLLSYFARGRSFTGEEVVEISCHGGDWLARRIVELVLEFGARPAQRGEFTYRAFMNGRIDLVQAEGVLTLIESRSKPAAQAALRQMKGRLSARLEEILDALTWVAAHLEANIDFAEEGLEVATQSELKNRLSQLHQTLGDLLLLENQSRFWREGFAVALVGLANVGKSTLLNSLLQEERAIVTDVPGTTRDLVRGQFEIQGVQVELTDTAGLRSTDEPVERLGIERAKQAARETGLLIYLMDGQAMEQAITELGALLADFVGDVLIVHSKIDLLREFSPLAFRDSVISMAGIRAGAPLAERLLKLPGSHFIGISAQSKLGLAQLEEKMSEIVKANLVEDAPGALRSRQVELLKAGRSAVHEALRLLNQGASSEFIAFELKTAVNALLESLGRRFDDQIMDRVFNEFCLGK